MSVSSSTTMDLHPHRRLALVAVCLAGLLIQLDVTIVNVALPTIERDLSATAGDLVWVISGYALSLAGTIPLMGAMGDRFGHKRILLGGLAWFGVCSVGAALAPGVTWLIGARLGQGIGGGAMLALTLAALSDVYPPERRTHAIGWRAAVGGTGFGAGPIAGGLLLATGAWSTIFWINVPLVALAMVLIAIAVPSHAAQRQDARPVDVPGLVLACTGVALVTYGLITVSAGSMILSTVLPIGLGVLALGGFVAQQRHASAPLIPVAVRRSRTFMRSCAVYFASYTAFSGTLYYLTLLFQNLRGWTALSTGLSWLFMNVPFLLVAQSVGTLRQRFSSGSLVTIGCGTAAIGIAILSVSAATTPFALVATGYLISGAGFGLLVPAITGLAMNEIPPEVSGAASAVLNSSRQLGTATGLAVIGAIGAAVTRSAWSGSGQVTSGQLSQVAAGLQGQATHAFKLGFHVALGLCLASLLIATGIAGRIQRKPTKAQRQFAETAQAEK